MMPELGGCKLNRLLITARTEREPYLPIPNAYYSLFPRSLSTIYLTSYSPDRPRASPRLAVDRWRKVSRSSAA